MRRTSALLIIGCAVLILGSSPAGADPVELTGGGVSISFEGRPHIWTTLVVGDTVYSVTRDSRPGEVINPVCQCPPGSLIDVSNVLTGPFTGSVSYLDARPALFPVLFEGTVSLVAPPVVVQEPIGPGFLTSGPFEMLVTLSAFHGNSALFLNRTFAASGTFGLMLHPDGRFMHIGYDLPEVPEPSTIWMLGTGAAALLARRRRLRQEPG
jgi:hypothetical protein